MQKPFFSKLFPFGARSAIVGIGVDADAATGHEEARHLNVLGIHQANQVFHDNVDTVLMKVAMVAEREEIELQALALHHALVGYIRDAHFSEIRLAGDGAQAGELWTIESHPIVIVGVLVGKRLQYFWCILVAVLGLGTEELQPLIFSCFTHRSCFFKGGSTSTPIVHNELQKYEFFRTSHIFLGRKRRNMKTFA